MRVLIVCLALAVLFVTPADAHHRPGHGKVSTTEPTTQSPPVASALQVVDANNAIVGQFTFNGCFVRQVDGYWVDLCRVQTDGTAVNESLPTRFFLEPGCQGTPFIESLGGALLSRFGYTGRGHFEFAGDPITVITVISWEFQSSPAEDSWTCIDNEEDLGDGASFPLFDVLAGPLHSIPLSTLGTPPFQIR